LEKSLRHLGTALPIAGRAVALRQEFNRSLLESIRYLIEACEEVIPPERFVQLTTKLDSLRPEMKLSGLLGAIHEDLLHAIEQEDIEKVNQISLRLCEDNFYVPETVVIGFSDLEPYYVPLVKEKFSQVPREIRFSPLSSEEFKKKKILIKNTIESYKDSFADFFTEFEELVSEIFLLKAEGLRAGSSFDLFGMIYKNILYKCEKITDVLEFIVHEQSHLYVFLLNRDDPIVINAQDVHDSPLRTDKRPLMGIYHAVFVIARIQHIWCKALASHIIPEAERAYCEEQIQDHRTRFRLGFDTLQKHAQMTPLGEALIKSANELVHTL
jgi:hypothetical protein